MGIFGWDLPPGCTTRALEEAMSGGRDPNETEEAVWVLLEEAGVPDEVNVQVFEVLARYYDGLAAKGEENLVEFDLGY